jgi:hypothetical protein
LRNWNLALTSLIQDTNKELPIAKQIEARCRSIIQQILQIEDSMGSGFLQDFGISFNDDHSNTMINPEFDVEQDQIIESQVDNNNNKGTLQMNLDEV